MADTAVPYTNLVANGSVAQAAGTTIVAANTHTIAKAVPERTVLRVTNTNGADATLVVTAGDYPPGVAAGQGGLSVTVPATSGIVFVGPFESGRFLQNDGSMVITTSGSHAGTITAYKVPRNA